MDIKCIKMLNIVCWPTPEIPVEHQLAVINCLDRDIATVKTIAGETLIENAIMCRSNKEASKILIAIPDVKNPTMATININGTVTLETEVYPVEQFEVFLMPTSHLCFGYNTGLPEHIEAGKIVAKAVDLIDSYAGYYWNIEFTRGIANFAEKYTKKMKMAKKQYKDGLLNISPYWTPANFEIYDSEAQIRQLAEAQWWLKENMGNYSTVAMGCDSSGFDPQQPQIFMKAGINFFWHCRYTLNGKDYGSPFLEHKGIDGTMLYCFVSRSPMTYNYIWSPIDEMWRRGYKADRKALNFYDMVEKTQEYMNNTKKICGVNFNIHFSGTDQSYPDNKQKDAWNKIFRTPALIYSTIGLMADKLMETHNFLCDNQEQEQPPWAPVSIAGMRLTLPLQEASYALTAAEKAAVFDFVVNSTPYPVRELRTAWLNVLSEQHHEQLGYGADYAVKYSYELIKRAKSTAKDITLCALQRIASRINFRGAGHPVTVFNLLNWRRNSIVEIPVKERDIVLSDANGDLVPYELLDTGILRFMADVEGLGYNSYYITESGLPVKTATDLQVSENTIENDYYRLIVDSHTGCIKELFDKELDVTILKGNSECVPFEFIVHEDSGNGYCTFWETGRLWSSKDIEGAKVKSTISGLSSRIIVERPLLDKNGEARVGNYIQIEYELPTKEKRLDVKINLDWDSEPKREIRLLVPLALKDPDIFYDTLLSTSCYDRNLPQRQHLYAIKLSDDGRIVQSDENYRLFDWRCVTRFVSAYEEERNIGITLTAPHGLLRVEHDRLFFTLIEDRTDCYVNMLPKMKGRHVFYTSITSHNGNWKVSKAWRFGWENRGRFNQLIAVEGEKLCPYLPEKGQLMRLDGENLVLTTLKKSKIDEDIIMRVYDAAGEGDQFGFNLMAPYLGYMQYELDLLHYQGVADISEKEALSRTRKPLSLVKAYETNLLEDPERNIELADTFNNGIFIRPFEIFTARLTYEQPQRSWINTYGLNTGLEQAEMEAANIIND